MSTEFRVNEALLRRRKLTEVTCGKCLKTDPVGKNWTSEELISINDKFYRCYLCPQCQPKYYEYISHYFKDAQLKEM